MTRLNGVWESSSLPDILNGILFSYGADCFLNFYMFYESRVLIQSLYWPVNRPYS